MENSSIINIELLPLQKKAEQGDAQAQYDLGNIYLEGKDITQNYEEAVKWFRKAAEQGLATAQYELGVMYKKGKGATQDFTKAVKWYTKAAKQGDADAEEVLREMGY